MEFYRKKTSNGSPSQEGHEFERFQNSHAEGKPERWFHTTAKKVGVAVAVGHARRFFHGTISYGISQDFRCWWPPFDIGKFENYTLSIFIYNKTLNLATKNHWLHWKLPDRLKYVFDPFATVTCQWFLCWANLRKLRKLFISLTLVDMYIEYEWDELFMGLRAAWVNLY